MFASQQVVIKNDIVPCDALNTNSKVDDDVPTAAAKFFHHLQWKTVDDN